VGELLGGRLIENLPSKQLLLFYSSHRRWYEDAGDFVDTFRSNRFRRFWSPIRHPQTDAQIETRLQSEVTVTGFTAY